MRNSDLDSMLLLECFLKHSACVTDFFFTKKLAGTITQDEQDAAKTVADISNAIAAVYFFRQDSDLGNVLNKMPLNQRKVMEDSLRTIWKHLLKLNEIEIADLVIEAIAKFANIQSRFIPQEVSK